MVTSEHFQRLKHIYRSTGSTTSGKDVVISYGAAELHGSIDSGRPKALGDTVTHHQLLRDVSSLAAGTVEKEHFVTVDSFMLNMIDSSYTGPVRASAEIVLAEPPQYIVEAVLVTPDESVIAEAQGTFQPSDTPLPSDPVPDESGSNDQHRDASAWTSPASFMPIHTTPYGVLCLN